MTANDSTPGSGESASDVATTEQQRLTARYAELWDRLRLAFLEAGMQIEEGNADAELVEDLREELNEADAAVDELEEFVEAEE
jgi:hypothetical protein